MKKILVICGGDSLERRVSLASGDAVAKGLISCGYEVLKLDTANPSDTVRGDLPLLEGAVGKTPPEEARNARLEAEGWVKLVQTIVRNRPDAVFPILHGGWGEDGRIQALLELLHLPYLGSGVLASQLCMNKVETKRIVRSVKLPCPEDWIIPGEMSVELAAKECLNRLGLPCVVKPIASGSAVDVFIVYEAEKILGAMNTIRRHGDQPFVERYIAGRELTVTILDDEALPVIEIAPKSEFYDYTRKYTKGETNYLCPAPLDNDIGQKVQEWSLIAFRELGCRHVGRVDWRLDSQGNPFFLEVNTIPGMTELSLVPMAAKAVGLSFDQLMDRLVKMVLRD